jgi:hypothetical protein
MFAPLPDTVSTTPPPSKPSLTSVAELISSIHQQFESLNPTGPLAGEGLQLDFAAAAEEDHFPLGTLTPLLGLGLGMATAATEKEVCASGLPWGVPL